ncbi:hypothetical protein MN608_11379 [Microdochium nivale]|nr:hypothetical protein MN608_11379 [Microdochium nivale]
MTDEGKIALTTLTVTITISLGSCLPWLLRYCKNGRFDFRGRRSHELEDGVSTRNTQPDPSERSSATRQPGSNSFTIDDDLVHVPLGDMPPSPIIPSNAPVPSASGPVAPPACAAPLRDVSMTPSIGSLTTVLPSSQTNTTL